jgi:hypothetical protein
VDRSDFINARFGKRGQDYELKDTPVLELDEIDQLPEQFEQACHGAAGGYFRVVFPAAGLSEASRLLSACVETDTIILEALQLDDDPSVALILSKGASSLAGADAPLLLTNRLALAYLQIDECRARCRSAEELISKTNEKLKVPATAGSGEISQAIDDMQTELHKLREERTSLSTANEALRSRNQDLQNSVKALDARLSEQNEQLATASAREAEHQQQRSTMLDQLAKQKAVSLRLREKLKARTLTARLRRLLGK